VVLATGVGSLPGADAAAFAEAVRLVLDQVPDLAYLPELPRRGADASMTGRALALLVGLGADLQPAGWRLHDSVGADLRRARSTLGRDLDLVEELTQGYVGPFKVQVTGPWTLAATVERPRGDLVLGDHGARRDLAQSLAEGVAAHVADLRRRLPGARLLVQLDEPALPAVLAGRVPTASGLRRHRTVEPHGASETLGWVLAAVAAAGAESVVHCCAAEPPVALLLGAGAGAVSLDLDQLGAADLDAVAQAWEDGHGVHLGVVPTREPEAPTDDRQLTERVLRTLDLLGLGPADVAERLVITPSCGLADAGERWARRAHQLARTVASNLG
jgi:methionine synthase II (cobalamin-independent)